MARREQRHWRFVTAAPIREVFASVEQMMGTPPYRFEPLGPAEARVVEAERRSFFGQWRPPRRSPRLIRISAVSVEGGTEITVESTPDRPSVARSLQAVQLFSRGTRDRRTIYRERRIPPGPVSLVASWAGMPYRLFTEPRYDAQRGAAVVTASRITALGEAGGFVKVRTADGDEGYVEKDQIVPAPQVATREAQPRVARLG